MLGRKKAEQIDPSQLQISLEMFLESYNQNIPAGFSRASVAMLRKFQSIYPALFKHGDRWSIVEHRKRVIDWLYSYRDVA